MADYSVSDINDCKMVAGNPPVEDLAALLAVWKEQGHTQVSSELASAQQASLVVGAPDALKKWEKSLGLPNG